MNNKSDKKHERKQKQKKKQPKNKKKTASQSKKKKEIKNGGAFSLSGLFSRKKTENSENKDELNPLLPPTLLPPTRPNSNNLASSASNNRASSASNKLASSASNNPQPPQPEIPNIQPNAKPQGFNTLKAQSRCSIM
jgi:hypothetical protein